ncbi:MAG: SMR family transporter [bacterium]|nr:SMR family transporter [bacterium]
MSQVFLLLLIDIFTTAGAQILFKKGVSQWGALDFSFSRALSLIPQILQNVWIMAGVFLFGVSFMLWLFILSKLQLNAVYPIALSSGVVITTIAAWIMFREHLLPTQILGIAIIIVGIFLLLKS